MPEPRILEVDLTRYESGDRAARQAVIAGVLESLGTGFVYLRHDVPEDVIDRAYELLAAFFHLPREVKERSARPGSHGQTGYTGLLVETAAGETLADWKEMLNWGRELPEHHPLRRRYPHRYMERGLPEDAVPGIEAALGLLWARFEDVQRRALRIIAEGIGCAPAFFDGMLADGPTLCRAIRYPPMDEAPAAGHVWAAEHEDINLVTVLPRATAPGLQVRVAGGEWAAAVAPPGFAILNTGMLLARITNGRIAAGPHRVVAPPGANGERISVVQFCHPSPWTILAPVASCITPDRPQRHAPIEAGAWLDQVLYDINLFEEAGG